MLNIPHGLVWFHVTGPDGPAVLLGDHDSHSGLITLCDDHCTYRIRDGFLHKWRVLHVEEVVRPHPKTDPKLHLYLVYTGAGGTAVWAAPDAGTIQVAYSSHVTARLIGVAASDVKPGLLVDNYED